MNFGALLKQIGSGISDFLNNIFPEETITIYADKPYTVSSSVQNKPKITPTPTPTPKPYQHYIPLNHPDIKEVPQQIPLIDRNKEKLGGNYNLAQGLMENFDDIKQATKAAQMLAHKYSQTNLPHEVKARGENWNFGENPNFFTDKTDLQDNNTYDMGLMRNNTGTFDDLLGLAYWPTRMKEAGLNSHADLNDPEKSLKMARLVLESSNWDNKKKRIRDNPTWHRWFNAPLENRH